VHVVPAGPGDGLHHAAGDAAIGRAEAGAVDLHLFHELLQQAVSLAIRHRIGDVDAVDPVAGPARRGTEDLQPRRLRDDAGSARCSRLEAALIPAVRHQLHSIAGEDRSRLGIAHLEHGHLHAEAHRRRDGRVGIDLQLDPDRAPGVHGESRLRERLVRFRAHVQGVLPGGEQPDLELSLAVALRALLTGQGRRSGDDHRGGHRPAGLRIDDAPRDRPRGLRGCRRCRQQKRDGDKGAKHAGRRQITRCGPASQATGISPSAPAGRQPDARCARSR
jgi:hypothetical protein